MQTTRLSILIVVGALLCTGNGVWGSWIPSFRMTAQSNLDGAVARRKFTARDGIPLNEAVATGRTLRNDVLLPYAIAKTKDANGDVEAKSVTDVFKILGGEAQGRPCCTSWGPGRVDCFIRAPKSNVMHISVENGVYSEWEDLGGVIVDEIECVSRDVGIITVLVLDVAIGLNVNTFSDGKWSGWQSKSGRLMEVPSCAVRTPSTINCMLRGTTNKGYHIGAVDGKWTNYYDLGGSLFGPVGCSSRKETHFNCFVSGMNLNLYQRYWIQGSGWGGYENLGGLVKGRPSVTTWDGDRIDVFSVGVMTNSVMQKTFNGKWQEWVDLGGVFDSEPECVTTGVGKNHCFAIGANSYLYKNDYADEKWGGWVSTYTPFLETPSCVVSNENEVSCYMRGFNKKLIEVVYKYA